MIKTARRRVVITILFFIFETAAIIAALFLFYQFVSHVGDMVYPYVCDMLPCEDVHLHGGTYCYTVR